MKKAATRAMITKTMKLTREERIPPRKDANGVKREPSAPPISTI